MQGSASYRLLGQVGYAQERSPGSLGLQVSHPRRKSNQEQGTRDKGQGARPRDGENGLGGGIETWRAGKVDGASKWQPRQRRGRTKWGENCLAFPTTLLQLTQWCPAVPCSCLPSLRTPYSKVACLFFSQWVDGASRYGLCSFATTEYYHSTKYVGSIPRMGNHSRTQEWSWTWK